MLSNHTTTKCINDSYMLVWLINLFFKKRSLFILLLIATSVAAQQTHISSVEFYQLPIKEQLKLADKSRTSNPKLFKDIINSLNDKQSKLDRQSQHYLSLLNGYYLAYNGQYDAAEIRLKEILVTDADTLIKFRANYTLINVAIAKQNWTDGLYYLSNNINELPLIDSKEHSQSALLVTVQFYNQIKQYNLALSYINKLSNKSLSPTNRCLLNQLSLEAKYYLKELQSNDMSINKAINGCQKDGIIIVSNIIRLYKANLHLSDNQPQIALQQTLPYSEEIANTRFPMLIAEANNTIAQAYWKLGSINKAKFHALMALNVNIKVTNLMQGIDTFYLLYQIAKEQNDLQAALHYHERYSELDKKHLEGDKAKHLAFQLAEHQAFEQQSKISLLNEKNTLLETKQALSKAEVANTRLIVMVLIISLLLFTFWGGRLYKAHKRIKELAEFDALTGIFNRGHFTHVATSALRYCKSAKQDVSVIMFDLDHFKSINDNYGHATGDWALKETIKVCQNLGRKNDIFARLGGEEFCILLPSCHIRSAALVAEHCRSAIEEIVTEASGHDFKITASFGITDAKTSGFELEKLLADADEAAYDSKKSGRNRITVFTIEEEPEQKQLDSSWSIT